MKLCKTFVVIKVKCKAVTVSTRNILIISCFHISAVPLYAQIVTITSIFTSTILNQQRVVLADIMQLPILISATVIALSSIRVAGETYCGALEQSNPNSPSITSVSGTVIVPSDLSQYDGSGFQAYVGITGQSCISDYVQVNLDINVSLNHLPFEKIGQFFAFAPKLGFGWVTRSC